MLRLSEEEEEEEEEEEGKRRIEFFFQNGKNHFKHKENKIR